MKIEDNKKIFTKIDSLDIGDCFVHNSKLYMRICNNDYVQPDTYFQYMVINLVENKIDVFAGDAIVYKVNAKIVVGE